MTKLKAVFFDLDGVLVDTRELHFEALSKALSDLGQSLSVEEHKRFYDGLPTYKKIEILTKKHFFTNDQVEFLNSQKQIYTQELLDGKIKPSETLFEVFRFLKRHDVRIAICSNTKRSTLDFIIDKLQILPLIEFSLSNEDVKDPKPSPEIYLKAMKLANVTPLEALIFEDSPHGLIAANSSSARVHTVNNSSDITLNLIKKFFE